jgi:uncharacterized iron-regulated protein
MARHVMHMMVRSLPLVGLALAALVGCATTRERAEVGASAESPYVDPRTLQVGQILHLATGRLLSEREALDYLSWFPVVYVGESHDSADDHALELTVLKAMEERFPGHVALGLEMLERTLQPDADAFVRGTMSDKDFQRVWLKSWNDFVSYREILRFAREKKIPLLALNADQAMRRAAREGSTAPGSVAADLPEMDTRDPYHRAYVEAIMGGHLKEVKDPEAFYRVQVLWDETMADTAARYLTSSEGKGRRLIVFAGSAHVRYGFGIPRRLFRRVPLPFVIVEPFVNQAVVDVPREKLMEVKAPTIPLPPADIYWSVGYRDSWAGQVRLGVMIEDAGGSGARVTGVIPGGPGQRAGLVKGDLVVAVDGVEVKEASDVVYQVSLRKLGDRGSIEVVRMGEHVRLPVVYGVLRHGH